MYFLKTEKILKLLFFIPLIIYFSNIAQANLLISPMRVVIDGNTRSKKIMLVNSGSETSSYRIEWKSMVALSEGGYRELTDKEKKSYSGLEKIVRFSPKQVTLKPGQRQIVKLMLLNKGFLSDGEYRTHLAFIALPNQRENRNEPRASGISLTVLVSYTMPIIYRVGSVIVNPIINDISLVKRKETGITNIKIELFHDELFSTTGRLIAFWTPTNGSTRQVGILNNYTFYPEIKNATTQFPWKDFKLEPGTLEVRYEGQAEFSGLLLAQKTLTITQQMINSVK